MWNKNERRGKVDQTKGKVEIGRSDSVWSAIVAVI